MDLELTQIHEYKVFKDTGKAQFHKGKVVTPDGFQKIRVHFVYAVKHDGRFKARLVADGHLTKESVETSNQIVSNTDWTAPMAYFTGSFLYCCSCHVTFKVHIPTQEWTP